MNLKEIIELLKSGKVGVLPTDTIYGIVGLALNPQIVERIYDLRKRSKDKPMIILISSLKDLEKFNIKISAEIEETLNSIWPNPVSVILPCNNKQLEYLHRGKNSLAFRMPKNEVLIKILREVGPLVAPSANIEGEKPAENIDEAKKYFLENIEFYLDGGIIKSTPSTLVEFENNKLNILRQGDFKTY